MDATNPDRMRFDGTGVDSKLKQRLSDMADEVGARNTRVAIAVPVREIIAIFHDVFQDVPHTPDYDHTQGGLRWGGISAYSPSEVPEALPETGVSLSGDNSIHVHYEPNIASEGPPPVELTLAQAKEFFLAGLAAVAEGERRVAAEPVIGLSDDEVTSRLARGGVVVESLAPASVPDSSAQSD